MTYGFYFIFHCMDTGQFLSTNERVYLKIEYLQLFKIIANLVQGIYDSLMICHM